MTVAVLLLGRAGSPCFPGKNAYPVLDRPLMSYPLMAARASRHVDVADVSTDAEELMAIATEYGEEVDATSFPTFSGL